MAITGRAAILLTPNNWQQTRIANSANNPSSLQIPTNNSAPVPRAILYKYWLLHNIGSDLWYIRHTRHDQWPGFPTLPWCIQATVAPPGKCWPPDSRAHHCGRRVTPDWSRHHRQPSQLFGHFVARSQAPWSPAPAPAPATETRHCK